MAITVNYDGIDSTLVAKYDPSGGGLFSVEIPTGTKVEVFRDGVRLGVATLTTPTA